MIRKITENDIEKVYSLGKEYTSNFQSIYFLENYLKNSIYGIYIYEDGNIIKGFIIYTIIDKLGEVQIVFVDKKWRKQGIATRLLAKMEEDVQSILLEVKEDNTPAYNLYKKLGYMEVSKREKYYNGIDAIVMKKVIE